MMISTVAIFMLESHAWLKTEWLVQSRFFKFPACHLIEMCYSSKLSRYHSQMPTPGKDCHKRLDWNQILNRMSMKYVAINSGSCRAYVGKKKSNPSWFLPSALLTFKKRSDLLFWWLNFFSTFQAKCLLSCLLQHIFVNL